MEHRMLRKNCAMCGSVATRLLIDDHISNTTQKHNIPIFEHFDVRSGVDCFNTSRPRQNGRQIPDDIFKWILLNENILIPINISLKFVPKGLFDNMAALVQIMAWRRPGDKPLFEPMMVSLVTHICVTRPQWVNKVSYRTNYGVLLNRIIYIFYVFSRLLDIIKCNSVVDMSRYMETLYRG